MLHTCQARLSPGRRAPQSCGQVPLKRTGGASASWGAVLSTPLLTCIPVGLLVKVRVYFLPQKNKPQCTQGSRLLSSTWALFDLERVLMMKNHSIMDGESVKTAPTPHSFTQIIGLCRREGPPRVIWGLLGATGRDAMEKAGTHRNPYSMIRGN